MQLPVQIDFKMWLLFSAISRNSIFRGLKNRHCKSLIWRGRIGEAAGPLKRLAVVVIYSDLKKNVGRGGDTEFLLTVKNL